MTATFVLGDVRDVLDAIPDGSIDLVLTSPPFLALRSYLPADHPDKHREIGAEPGPAEFVDTLLGLSDQWRRKLAPHGSIAVELGDTYAGSGGAGGDYAEGGLREGQEAFAGSKRTATRKPKTMNRRVLAGDPAVATAQAPPDRLRTRRQLPGWPLDKSLCMIPELYRVALAYGINPLTGDPSPAGQWRARNVVRWCRPNPPVGALGDKVRPATSDMVIACTSARRYFDLDAIREPAKYGVEDASRPVPTTQYDVPGQTSRQTRVVGEAGRINSNAGGAPPLDHWWADPDDDVFELDAWLVSTEAYKGSHYATWPRKLLTRPILAMCPERVCTVCGEPSRRIVDTPAAAPHEGGPRERDREGRGRKVPVAGRVTLGRGATGERHHPAPQAETVGWSDCGHDSWRPGVVLDPFAGSGTTLAVATGHGRDAIGIDFDARNIDLACERVGPLLFDSVTLAEYVARQAVPA